MPALDAAVLAVAICLLVSPLSAQPTLSPSLPGALGGDEPPVGDGCEQAAVIKDDGMPEGGYGWVPSAIFGIFVQVFEARDFVQPLIDEVCVCFQRSRDDDSIDFEVVFYRDVDGNPAEEPFAVVPATLDDVPDITQPGPAGRFARVATPGVRPPGFGRYYIGVRWNPSADQFFFVCDDQSESTERVNVWFRDDRAEGWDNADETNDPIFLAHRAMLIRPVGSQVETIDVPSTGPRGLALLAAVLLAAGVLALRRTS